ncbi:MAG TPA: universal stress protein, partial [Planctomycetota bacterium]|nr:universal stress protein [Planctomycetota bacterium]
DVRLERVLAAIDFSPSSDAVLAWARRLVAGTGSIRVLHVIDTSVLAGGRQTPPSLVLGLQEQLESEARQRLESLTRAEPGGDGRLVLDVAFGSPATEIATVCEKERIELVLVGAHASEVGEHLASGSVETGSVTAGVALGNRAPTMVVRDFPDEGGVERVIGLVDLTAPSIQILRVAERLGRRLQAGLVPLQVVESRDMIDGATRVLHAFVRGALGRAVQVEVVAGSADKELLARTTPRDIVVSGTRSRAAREVVLPCPVVLVRPVEEGASRRAA